MLQEVVDTVGGKRESATYYSPFRVDDLDIFFSFFFVDVVSFFFSTLSQSTSLSIGRKMALRGERPHSS